MFASDGKEKVDLKKQFQKIIMLAAFLGGFPFVLTYFGVDVINDCATYTIADYEAAKSDKTRDVAQDDIGQCIRVSDSSTGTNTYVDYFNDVYTVYAVIIVLLMIVIPGYKIMVY